MHKLIHFFCGLLVLSTMANCQFGQTFAQQFYKVCNGDLGPHVLLCSPRTGVVVRSTDILFTLQANPNKECETISYFNISDPVQNLESICERARDRSICEIPREFSTRIFTTRYFISEAYFPVPIRYQVRFDCLESAYRGSAWKLSSNNIVNLFVLKLIALGFSGLIL